MGEVLVRHAGYDEDFFFWTQQQAEALRSMPSNGTNTPLDWENIAEEIESLGKRDRRACESQVNNILTYLLKYKYWPSDEPRRHWQSEIYNFRDQLERILRDSPSLRARLPDFVKHEYANAISKVAFSLGETKIATEVEVKNFFARDQISAEQLLDRTYFPTPSVLPASE